MIILVDEWYSADSVLESYSWKATFFVSKIHELSQGEIVKLQSMQNKGHEIAGHGYNSKNTVNYVNEYGIKKISL
ncbi:polysaccharide deacetylase family protein [Reichenbachiella sp.]